MRLLNEEHVRISITDPKALPNAKRDLADICREGLAAPAPLFAEDPYDAAKDADAVLLMTDWKLYPSLDWARIFASMRKPALVFDTRNCLDREKLREIGFKVLNVGK